MPGGDSSPAPPLRTRHLVPWYRLEMRDMCEIVLHELLLAASSKASAAAGEEISARLTSPALCHGDLLPPQTQKCTFAVVQVLTPA